MVEYTSPSVRWAATLSASPDAPFWTTLIALGSSETPATGAAAMFDENAFLATNSVMLINVVQQYIADLHRFEASNGSRAHGGVVVEIENCSIVTSHIGETCSIEKNALVTVVWGLELSTSSLNSNYLHLSDPR